MSITDCALGHQRENCHSCPAGPCLRTTPEAVALAPLTTAVERAVEPVVAKRLRTVGISPKLTAALFPALAVTLEQAIQLPHLSKSVLTGALATIVGAIAAYLAPTGAVEAR